MIELHYWTTPNGHKVTMFLEEAGLPYRIVPVNIGKGDQFKPEFLAISPNNRIPAIVDEEPADGGAPLSVFESGAILLYLAEKTGKLISSDPRRRVMALEWLFWQMGGLGPMAGQNHHFAIYAPEKLPYGKVKATVVDREGKALSDQHVIVLPKTIRAEAELADIAVSGQTDQNGEWTSAAMAPGRYYVLASRTPFDRTPETIARLWGTRDKGKEIEVAPGATADAAVPL
jgi:glutathione S-transferase